MREALPLGAHCVACSECSLRVSLAVVHPWGNCLRGEGRTSAQSEIDQLWLKYSAFGAEVDEALRWCRCVTPGLAGDMHIPRTERTPDPFVQPRLFLFAPVDVIAERAALLLGKLEAARVAKRYGLVRQGGIPTFPPG